MTLPEHPFKPGSVVRSTAGHDRSRLYLVLKTSSSTVWLTDGRLRPVDKMKVKNCRHVRMIGSEITSDRLAELAQLKDNGQKNALIRRLLKDFEDTFDQN